tara:strand:+ start:577 stop:783 length:207 start_codon:yes stop_codon:yes gene_type:complete
MTVLNLGSQVDNNTGGWNTNYYLINKQLQNDRKIEIRKTRCKFIFGGLFTLCFGYSMGILTCHLSDIC